MDLAILDSASSISSLTISGFSFEEIAVKTFFIADFYCFEEKLIIEIDGKIHDYKLKEDTARTEILNYLGIRVIRFGNEMVSRNLLQVLEIVKKNFTHSPTPSLKNKEKEAVII